MKNQNPAGSRKPKPAPKPGGPTKGINPPGGRKPKPKYGK